MDLHFTSAEPTHEEKAAVDDVISAIASEDLRPRRTHLLPTLNAIQIHIGWISEGALNYVSRKLEIPPADAFGVATFYGLLSTRPQPPVRAQFCDDLARKFKGAAKNRAEN